MCQRGGRRWDGKKERNKANKSRNKRETARPRPRGGWRRLALPIDGHDILPPCQPCSLSLSLSLSLSFFLFLLLFLFLSHYHLREASKREEIHQNPVKPSETRFQRKYKNPPIPNKSSWISFASFFFFSSSSNQRNTVRFHKHPIKSY